MMLSPLLLGLFLRATFRFDFTELLESLEDIILIILHLDRIYDLLYFSKDVIVLCLDACHYFLPSE